MPDSSSPDPSTAERRSIETLKAEYESLNTKRITAEADLKSAEARLKELQKEAREEFGTSDLDALQAKLKTMEEENERARRDYQQMIDGINQKLTAIEQPSAEASPEDEGTS